jgi:hypothetical protein
MSRDEVLEPVEGEANAVAGIDGLGEGYAIV